MFSTRVPASSDPNRWYRRYSDLRQRGEPLADLTESNPTRTGLSSLEAAAESLARAARAPYDPEPRGLRAAREAVAAFHAARGDRVHPDDLVLTTGTAEGVTHLVRVLADPGETILVPAPGYPLFAPIAAAEGVRAEPYRLAWEGRWTLDLDSVGRGLAGGARAVFVVEPNPPTGSRLAESEWDALVELVARHDAAIVADEVFADHGWDPGRSSFASRAGEARATVFTLGGISKTCGLPQHKLGWIAASGPATAKARAIEGLEWLADLTLGLAGPVQVALPELLESRHGFLARARERVRANLAAWDAFAMSQEGVERRAGEGGWTALLRLPASRDDEAWALALLEHGVAVHPGHFYDLDEEGFVAPSLIVTLDTTTAAIRRIESALR